MTTVADLRARGHAFWAGAAPGWIKHAGRQDEMGPAGAAYRAAPPAAQSSARTGAARLLARFREPATGYRLPSKVWCATGVNPG